MKLHTSGKRALITGASGGLGAHFAQVLAGAGASVTLAARRTDRLQSQVEALRAAGHTADALELDVADAASVTAALHGRTFDIVVNNAGISGSGMAIDMPVDEWDRVFATNLRGCFLVAQAAAQGMRDAGTGGSIINIASILGLRVGGAVSAYASSKAGLVQMTAAMALEWARFGIRVNALCPGYFETEINQDFFGTEAGKALIRRIPQRRLGRTEELTAPLLLLASDASSFMTGSTVTVDGGHMVSSL